MQENAGYGQFMGTGNGHQVSDNVTANWILMARRRAIFQKVNGLPLPDPDRHKQKSIGVHGKDTQCCNYRHILDPITHPRIPSGTNEFQTAIQPVMHPFSGTGTGLWADAPRRPYTTRATRGRPVYYCPPPDCPAAADRCARRFFCQHSSLCSVHCGRSLP